MERPVVLGLDDEDQEVLMASRRSGRALAIATAPVRCAVYTRKSTDEGLDKDFNTLDAQRGAAESYIESQRHEAWNAIPERYDDGGYSGGNLERPALKRLLADVAAGLIDVVVVYKYDRLSRSMLDFLQMLDFFERHDVSFVSVSQRFDTSTPIGRMTLQILMSFGEFERQIIAERTRDKIHAARRRGKWTGGTPPLGYDIAPEGGRLVANKTEAALVNQIFKLYVDSSSLVKVAEELTRRGWQRKSWTTRDGKRRQCGRWDRGNVRRLLTDPICIGKQKLGAETFRGEHRGIVPKALFDKVQRLLDQNLRDRGARTRNKHGALLRGLLRCSACNAAMAFAPAKRGGKVYRYYRCSAAVRNGHRSCPTRSINADRVDQFVVDEIRRIGADPALQEATFTEAVRQVKAHARGLRVEAKRLKKDLERRRADVERLVATVSRVTGQACSD